MIAKKGRTWLITAASSGFGRALAEVVLAKGDRVFATARDESALTELSAQAPERCRTAPLDVTDDGQIAAAVALGREQFGGIDVLANIAGAAVLGPLESLSDEVFRSQFETNFLGAVKLMRAVLPAMRERQNGHIVNMSAIPGFSNEPGFSAYGASKAALEAASEAVALEVAPFGIRVSLIIPGPFRTGFIERTLSNSSHTNGIYELTVGKLRRALERLNGHQQGDPAMAAEAIIRVVESESPPLRLAVGPYAIRQIRVKLQKVASEINSWEEVGKNTGFSAGSR
jgi:NAD(P)-dependent dehydrogenase (short-subunit alcohol dehydrogenase family)